MSSACCISVPWSPALGCAGRLFPVLDSPRPTFSLPGSFREAPQSRPFKLTHLGGTQQCPHLPRIRLPASAPGGVLLPASALLVPPAVQSFPGSGLPAPGPVSCCGPGVLASAPLSLQALLGAMAGSGPEPCFSLAFAPQSLLRFHSAENTPAPFGVCFPDSVPGAWGQHLGPGESCSPGWAAAGASAGGVVLRLPPRVTSSSPGVSVSCTWMEILGQREMWP